MRCVKYLCVSSSAICLVWSQQPSRVVLIAKISFLIDCPDLFWVPVLVRVWRLRRGVVEEAGQQDRQHRKGRTAKRLHAAYFPQPCANLMARQEQRLVKGERVVQQHSIIIH